MLNKCFFCNLSSDRIISQTEFFTLSLCLGPLVAGHIIAILNFHAGSFANISANELNAFRTLRDEIKELYSARFGTCLFFEHGNHATNEYSTHSPAHLHIIPLPLTRQI